MITHLHHIVPRHVGGSDDPSNLVRLSIAEHAEAHRCLFEEFGRQEDRLAWLALSGMLGQEEIVRQAMLIGAKKGGAIGGRRGGLAGKGKKKPAGFGEKVSAAVSGPKNGMFGVKLTPAQKERQSAGVKRAVATSGDEWQGSKNLISSASKRLADGTHPSRIAWTCEHCGKSSVGTGNYHRYHGKNCKKISEQPSSSIATTVATSQACTDDKSQPRSTSED